MELPGGPPDAHLASDVHGHVLRGGGCDVADLAVVAAGALHAHAAHLHAPLVLAAAQVRLVWAPHAQRQHAPQEHILGAWENCC